MDNCDSGLVLVRKAKPEDLAVIIDFKLSMFGDAGITGLLSENSRRVIEQTYRELYDEGAAVHFLLEVDRMAVACAGAFLKRDIPFCFYKIPFYGFIGDVYTLPQHRRRGYAGRLAREAIGWLRERDVYMIRLLATEQGRKIYEKLGFRPSDEMVLML